jgi:DNA-binding Lrp family transcriptional regulator
MSSAVVLDQTDRQIIALLQENARRTLADIDARVRLSVAPVKRRLDRLEAAGVVVGYTALVNEAALGSAVEAFMQLQLTPGSDVADVRARIREVPEVREVMMTAGEQDMLVRLSVTDIDNLRTAVIGIRNVSAVTATRTHIVLDRWRRGEVELGQGRQPV